jgi:serine/threonine protein kinase
MTPDDGEGRISRYGDVFLSTGHELAGKYIIESIIGEGSTSIVYTARRKPSPPAGESPAARELADEDDPAGAVELVALKVIHKRLCENPQIVGRFHREAAILRRLEGPHVVRVHEALQDAGMLVLVMEHVAGTPLDRRLEAQRPLDVKSAVEIALQVCAGLGTAHAAGVVHRDLKPANVLFAAEDSDDRFFVKVADFGLAKVMQGEKITTALTEHDMIFGTPEYMAPEQARGDDLDARADIYAVGCLLYEMLTGDVPFRESSVMVTMTAHLTKAVVPPRQRRSDGAISAALEAVVLRALAKTPDARYPSARALAEALDAATAGKSVVARAGAADALGDTDLNVSVMLARSGQTPRDPALETTAPGGPADAITGLDIATTGRAGAPVAGDAEASAPDDAAPVTSDAIPLTRRGGPTWLWITIAVIAAIAGIAIGIAIGSR